MNEHQYKAIKEAIKEIECLAIEVSNLKVVYELVIEQSHLCSDKRCIGLFPEEGKHRCRLCTEMLAAVTAVKEQI